MKTRLKQWFAAAVVAGAGVWSAQAAMTHSAAVVDTRADVLAEILPATCAYALDEDAVLTVTFNESVTDKQYVLPDNMGPLAFDLNGKTITGAAGTTGGASAAGGNGAWVFKVGSGTTISVLDGAGSSGRITGGKGGNGHPAGAGAFAFVNASGAEFAVADAQTLVSKGADGLAICTVTLDAQGGTGGSASVTATYGAAMPSATMPTKGAYTFLGYFDAQTDGVKYYNADGTSAANWDKTANTTLYAQWEAKAIPVEGDVTVKVDDKWIKEHGLEGKTEKEIAEKLNETDTTGTGLKKWQNLALGVKDGEAAAKPAFTGAAKGTTGKVSFALPGYTGNAESGVTATRKLVKTVGATTTETDLALDATAVEVGTDGLNEEEPVALYTTVIAFANANGAEVKSENTVGVMYVKTPAQKAMVAVPWEQIGGGAISAADLIDTRDLADGDKLHVYDKVQSRYKTWTLKDGAWSPLGTRKIEAGKVSELSAGDPGEATIARGDGVWLERGNTEKPFHLIGQYNAEKVTLPSAAGWNICGNAGIEKAAVADLGAGDGDTIIVPTEAEPIRYTKKDGAWGCYKETVTEVEVKGRKVKTSVWTTEDCEIGVGQGFWLVK